jgi:hypothetical protein
MKRGLALMVLIGLTAYVAGSRDDMASATPAQPAAPTPPPTLPPRPIGSAAPPALATFLRSHATGHAPWQITVHELGDKGPGFLGRKVKASGKLDPKLADQLVADLANDNSFDASAYGGVTPRCLGASLGIRLARDGATFDLAFECGHFQLADKAGPIGVSSTMYVFMSKVEAWALPCVPLVIDSLDVEICAARGSRLAGGSGVISSPLGICDQLSVGIAAPGETKYLRKVGTLELACRHDDTPECVKACETLRPLPNSTATQPFPAGPPAIKTSLSGTWISSSGVEIWNDGTVLFAGPRCRKVRSQRAKVTPEQVTTLLADIQATGFFTPKKPRERKIADAPIYYLRVTAGDQTNEMHLGGGRESAELNASRELIQKLVGDNPCK